MSYDYGYGYDAVNTAGAVGGIVAGALIGLLIFSIIAIVFAILMIIGQWKCFKKAGYNGWEALIAGHNQFVNCTFAGANPILILVLMFGSVVSIIPIVGSLAYLGFVIYYQFHVGIKTAKAFGKGTGFGVALAIPISAPIAWFILGKDNVRYVGVNNGNKVGQNAPVNPQPQMNEFVQQPVEPTVNPQPQMNEFVQQPIEPTVNPQPQMNEFVQQPIEPTVNPQPAENNNCSRCGAPINQGDRFCMHCGNQL